MACQCDLPAPQRHRSTKRRSRTRPAHPIAPHRGRSRHLCLRGDEQSPSHDRQEGRHETEAKPRGKTSPRLRPPTVHAAKTQSSGRKRNPRLPHNNACIIAAPPSALITTWSARPYARPARQHGNGHCHHAAPPDDTRRQWKRISHARGGAPCPLDCGRCGAAVPKSREVEHNAILPGSLRACMCPASVVPNASPIALRLCGDPSSLALSSPPWHRFCVHPF